MGFNSGFKGLRVPEAVSLEVKRPWREALSSSAEVKNEWSCISAPLICLRGVPMNKFIFTLLHCVSQFLGAFTQLRKATIRPSVSPHRTTRPPLDGFS